MALADKELVSTASLADKRIGRFFIVVLPQREVVSCDTINICDFRVIIKP